VPFLVAITTSSAPATVKINLDSTVLPAQAGGITASGVQSCVAHGTHTFVCTTSATTFSFPVQTSASRQGFADISAFYSDESDNDCAYDSVVVEVGSPAFTNGECGCSTRGTIRFNTDGSCSVVCDDDRRRSAEELVAKRGLTSGLLVSADVSVTFRRSNRHSDSSDSDAASRCGPQVTLLVDGKRIWVNSDVLFGEEGVISGSIEFLVPYGVKLLYELDIRTRSCSGQSVSIWDPHFTVREASGPQNVDSASPIERL